MAGAVTAFHPHHEPEGHGLDHLMYPKKRWGVGSGVYSRHLPENQNSDFAHQKANRNHARTNARTRTGAEPIDFGAAIGAVFSAAALPNAANPHPGIRDREQAIKTPPQKLLLVEKGKDPKYLNVKTATLAGKGRRHGQHHDPTMSPRSKNQARPDQKRRGPGWGGYLYG